MPNKEQRLMTVEEIKSIYDAKVNKIAPEKKARFTASKSPTNLYELRYLKDDGTTFVRKVARVTPSKAAEICEEFVRQASNNQLPVKSSAVTDEGDE